MQPNQQRRFSDTAPQQPVYRFASNQQLYGMAANQDLPTTSSDDESVRSKHQHQERKHKIRTRRKIFTWWNLFAVIGIVTTVVQVIRYLVIPALVYGNVIAGGLL